MAHSLDDMLEIIPGRFAIKEDEVYHRCLELACQVKSRSGGYGAILEAVFEDGSSGRFEGRSQRKRPGRYASSGFGEHAENVVLNDALDYAREHHTRLKEVTMSVAGIVGDKPYIYIEPCFSCTMCAAQISKELPENAEIRLPTAGGWVAVSPAQVYDSARRIRREKTNASDFRAKNSLLHK